MGIRKETAMSVGMLVVVSAAAFLMAAVVLTDLPRQARAEPGAANSEAVQDNKYVGLTKCAACHFSQYRDWQSTPHGNAFKILPAKYRKDESCLKCHTTEAAASSDPLNSPSSTQLGVSCEACHGPGGHHASYALSFVGQDRVFTEDQLTALRSKIQRTALEQCIKCHASKAHKPHPKFDRDPVPVPRASQSGELPPPKRSFFDVHGERSGAQ